MIRSEWIRRQKEIDNRDVVCVVCQILLKCRIHRECLDINMEFPCSPFEQLLSIYEHFFTPEESMIVLAITILYSLAIEHKSVIELNLNSLTACISEIHIIVSLFPFLGKMVHDVEDGKAKIGLARTVGTIDNAILNYVILNGIRAENSISVSPSILQFNDLAKGQNSYALGATLSINF